MNPPFASISSCNSGKTDDNNDGCLRLLPSAGTKDIISPSSFSSSLTRSYLLQQEHRPSPPPSRSSTVATDCTQRTSVGILQGFLDEDQQRPNKKKKLSHTLFNDGSQSSFVSTSSSSSVQANDAASAIIPSLLHRACQQEPQNVSVIRACLSQDSSAVGRSMLVRAHDLDHLHHKEAWLVHNGRGWRRTRYSLPINIAIQNVASMTVLEMLVQAGPGNLLRTPDGPDQETALHVATKYNLPVEAIDMLLLECPAAVDVRDRQNNTCLHTACQYYRRRGNGEQDGLLLVLKHLIVLDPTAVHRRNLHGLLPLEILYRSTTASITDPVLNYMEKVTLSYTLNHDI